VVVSSQLESQLVTGPFAGVQVPKCPAVVHQLLTANGATVTRTITLRFMYKDTNKLSLHTVLFHETSNHSYMFRLDK